MHDAAPEARAMTASDPFATYDPGPYYCELLTRTPALGPGLLVRRAHRRDRARGASRAGAGGRERAVRARGDLHGLFGCGRDRPHPAVRLRAPDPLARGVASCSSAGCGSACRRSTCSWRDIYNARHIVRDGISPGAARSSATPTTGRRWRASRSGSAPMSISAASTSCATSTAPSWCWRTMRARRPASPTSSRTGI